MALALLLAPCACAQEDALSAVRFDVAYLSSDLMEGREAGTRGEALAADYIAARFEELGLEPMGAEGWMQPFSFHVPANPHSPTGEGAPRG